MKSTDVTELMHAMFNMVVIINILLKHSDYNFEVIMILYITKLLSKVKHCD